MMLEIAQINIKVADALAWEGFFTTWTCAIAVGQYQIQIHLYILHLTG